MYFEKATTITIRSKKKKSPSCQCQENLDAKSNTIESFTYPFILQGGHPFTVFFPSLILICFALSSFTCKARVLHITAWLGTMSLLSQIPMHKAIYCGAHDLMKEWDTQQGIILEVSNVFFTHSIKKIKLGKNGQENLRKASQLVGISLITCDSQRTKTYERCEYLKGTDGIIYKPAIYMNDIILTE